MAAELGAARISVGLDTSKVAGEIKKAFSGVDADGSAAGKSAGGGFASGFKGIVGPAIAAVGAIGFGGLIAEAARASDATDKFKSTLNFAGLDTSAIEAATAAAKGYADETVYELSDIQKTMATLAANGVDDYTGITKAAGNLNAVAGGNAETFKSVSLALGQSAGAGKLMAEDWNMLADAIPGASGQLQDAMREAGAFEGNFKKAMESGEISAEEFQAAITKLGSDPIAVEAARSVSTFEGALGNLEATINSGLMSALNALKPAITGAINLLSNGLGAAFEWTGKAATGLIDLFAKGDFTGNLREAFNVEEDSKLVDFLFRIRDTAINVGNSFKTVWAGFKMPADVAASFGENLNPLLAFGQSVREVADKVQFAFKTVWAGFTMPASVVAGLGANIHPLLALGASVREALGFVGPLFQQIGSVIMGLIPQVLGLWTQFSPLALIFKAIQPIIPQLALAISGLAGALGAVLGSALTQIQPILGMLVETLSGVFVAIMPAVTAMVVTLSGALAQIIPVVMGVIASIMPLVATLISQLAPIITNLVTSVLPPIVSIFGNIVNSIAPLITIIAGLLIPIIMALMPVVVTVFSVVADVIKSAMQIVQGIIQVVTGIIKGDWDQVWTGIGNIFKGIWDTIVNLVRGALQIVGQVVMSGLGLVGGFVSSTLNNIGLFFSDTWNNVVNGVSGMIRDVTGFFNDLPQKIMGALGNIGGWLVDSGKALIQGFIDGISGMVGAIGDAVGGVLEAAREFFPFSPAKKGPFSGRGYTSFSGQALARDFAGGIGSQQNAVSRAAEGLMSSASLPLAGSSFGVPAFAPAGSVGAGQAGLGNLRIFIGNEAIDPHMVRIVQDEIAHKASLASGRMR